VLQSAEIPYTTSNPGDIKKILSYDSRIQVTPQFTGDKKPFPQQIGTTNYFVFAGMRHRQAGHLVLNTNASFATNLSFTYLVSSESGFDYFDVVINGQRIIHVSSIESTKSPIYKLKAGKNTIEFTYYKDGSVDENLDAVYLSSMKLLP
jgi:hypothetical protein